MLQSGTRPACRSAASVFVKAVAKMFGTVFVKVFAKVFGKALGKVLEKVYTRIFILANKPVNQLIYGIYNI